MSVELWFCFVVWVGHCLLAVFLSWDYSVRHWKNGDLWSGFFEPGWSILGGLKKDSADFEWHVWTKELWVRTVSSLFHSLVFHFATKFLPRHSQWKLMLPVWIGMHTYCYGFRIILQTVLYGWVLLGIVWTVEFCFPNRKTAGQLLVWVCSILLLCALVANSEEAENYEKSYSEAVLIAYKLLQYISFCMTYVDEDLHFKWSFMESSKNLFFFAFYWPYSVVLIVSYKSFRLQLHERCSSRPMPRELIFESLRLFLWLSLTDFARHFLYVNSFMNQPVILEVLPLPVLCSVGYLAGQLFQMKYMAIFGLPRIFALLDGMQPPGLPICISRVSLYSRMWRYFDRGLYAFMRDNIFIPVAGPTYTFARRTLATALSFGFVFLWHGASKAFLCWVLLNLVEIFIENIAKELSRKPPVSTMISTLDRSLVERARALLHIPCAALGILAIFFFLGENQAETGWVFVERIVLSQFFRPTWCFMHLVVLGYCYARCCIALETILPSG